MSFEGYYQLLCPTGHYWSQDCYTKADPSICPICGRAAVWENLVDTTNGNELEVVELKRVDQLGPHQCPTCGGYRLKGYAPRYEVPDKGQ